MYTSIGMCSNYLFLNREKISYLNKDLLNDLVKLTTVAVSNKKN